MSQPSLLRRTNLINSLDILLVLLFSAVPLFLSFPYRINIFLAWEGAYRIYLGQIPYKDFGLPMGFGFWIVPAIFFKIFGPYLITLVKAQVLINIIAGLSVRGIFKKFKIPPAIRISAIAVLCLSYIMQNFWPWYNNTEIVWEFAGLYFLLCFFERVNKQRYLFLFLSCLFLFLSFFTKQDGGALGFLLALVLVAYTGFSNKRWIDVILFILIYFIIGCLFILPFTKYNFGYWFNHGQPPHTARVSIKDLLDAFFGESQWIKFYFLIIVLLLIRKLRNWRAFIHDKDQMIFLLLTLGILVEAAIFQTTSYVPPDTNIFFHSFAIAYILTNLSDYTSLQQPNLKNVFVLLALVFLWWSGIYWKYFDRITAHLFPQNTGNIQTSPTGENVINQHTYMLNTDTANYEDESTWITIPGLKSFQKVYMPSSTVAGIQRLIQMPVLKNKEAKILNMTELTPLEYELNIQLEKGPDYPLWYHLGVGMFNKQTDTFCNKIKNSYYDLVLFEYAPTLNNFYPFRVRNTLQKYYTKVDTFFAPRRPTNAFIEVYKR